MADKDTHPHHYPHPQHPPPPLLLPPTLLRSAAAAAAAPGPAPAAPPPPPQRQQQQQHQRPRAIEPNLKPPGRRHAGSGDGDHTLACTSWDVTKDAAADDGSPKKKKLKLILKLRKPEEQDARDGSVPAARGSVISPLRSKLRPWVPKSDGLAAAAGPTTSTSASESLDDDAPSPENKKRKLRDPAVVEDLPRRRMKEAPPPAAANGVSTPPGQELQQLQGPQKVFAELLEKFQKKDTYSVFAEPVDPEEIPDYHEIIKEPMDFSTIRKKLVKGAYTSLELFERDVLLICSNAMKYNAPRTIYYKQAKAIKDTARKAFEALKGRINGHKKGGGKQNSSLKKSKRSAAVKKNADSSNDHAQNGLAPSEGKRASTLDRVADLNQKSNPHFQASFNDLEASEASLTRAISAKDARKLLAVDENRRNTYRPPGFFDDDFLTHLVPFGCHSSGAYAQSLAMFGANFNSSAWEFVARKIRQALAPNVPFGRGWVGEDQEPRATKGAAVQQEARDDAMDMNRTVDPMFQAIQTRLNRPAVDPSSSSANLPPAAGFFPGLDALAKAQADNATAAAAAAQSSVKHWLLPSTSSGTSTSVQPRANVESNSQHYTSSEANHSQQLQAMEANIKQFREATHRHADPGGQQYRSHDGNTQQQRKVEERIRYAEANPQLVVPSTGMQAQRRPDIVEFHGQQQQQLRPFGSGDVSNVANVQQLKFLGPKFVGNAPNSSDADAGRGLWTMPRLEIQKSVAQEHQSSAESAASTSLALSSLSGPYGRVGMDSSSALGQQNRDLFQSLKGHQQQQQQRHQQQQQQATSKSSSSQQQQQQHRLISDLNCRSDVNSSDLFSREGGQQKQQLPLDLYSAISQSLLQPWKSSQRAPNSVRPLPPDLNVRLQSPKSPQHQHHHLQLQPQLPAQHHHQQQQATAQQMQRPQAQAQPDLALQL